PPPSAPACRRSGPRHCCASARGPPVPAPATAPPCAAPASPPGSRSPRSRSSVLSPLSWTPPRLSRSRLSMLVRDLRAAYDARHRAVMDGAGLGIAEGEHIALDLAAEIPIGIDEDGKVMVLPGQLADEGLLGLLAIARKGRDAPEAPVHLMRDLK